MRLKHWLPHKRLWLGAMLAAVAACAVLPPAENPAASSTSTTAATDIYLNQGWSAADRAVFTTTPQGSWLMPLPWFQALRRTDRDEAFAADQLQRYGYLPNPAPPGAATPLPVGFVQDGTVAAPQLGITCAACHTGQLRYGSHTWRIDGGRADADFQAFLTDLGAAAQATLDQPARFPAFAARVLGPAATPAAVAGLRQELAAWTAQYTSFMAASLPERPWGPGRLDAFGMIFNRVAGLDLGLPGNLAKADAPVRYPFIWDAPRQDRTQWTGAAPNGTYLRAMARNTGEAFGVFGRFTPEALPAHLVAYRNSVRLSGLQALEEKLVALRPPPWPAEALPLNPVRVTRGAALFQTACAGCHGRTASRQVSNAWNTVVQDVGTDPLAFKNSHRIGSPGVLTGTRQPPVIGDRLADPDLKVAILANAVVGSLLRAVLRHDDGTRRAIARDLIENRVPLLGGASTTPAQAVADATRDAYKAADGETGAAYEARVLTGIWAAGPYLHNGSVANLWELLKPARERLTRFAVGHRDFDPVHVGLDTTAAADRAIFVADPATGNGNQGHEYGTTLPESDRWALIEYLKTL
jgi:mono/diheme cytochrome c family protein